MESVAATPWCDDGVLLVIADLAFDYEGVAHGRLHTVGGNHKLGIDRGGRRPVRQSQGDRKLARPLMRDTCGGSRY